jgi:ABC-type glutathione transport system ATPase component
MVLATQIRERGATAIDLRQSSEISSAREEIVAASRPAAGSLTVDHLVNEYSVGSGMLIQRRKGVVFAVSDVSFEIGLGETFGLVGESAAENQRLVE